MIIRTAKKQDTIQIEILNAKYFHEKNRNFADFIQSPNNVLTVAEQNNKIVGFTGVSYYKWNNTAKILDIFVHPQFRHKGIAKKLIISHISFAKKHRARVLIAEAPSKSLALPLYLKCGFRVCGYNDRYYNNSGKEIAIFLSYDLTK